MDWWWRYQFIFLTNNDEDEDWTEQYANYLKEKEEGSDEQRDKRQSSSNS